MKRKELLELVTNHENLGVVFMRDDVNPDMVAKEMSALLNKDGGVILLGIEKDQQICGLTKSREEVEEWALNIAQNSLQPSCIPVWTSTTLPGGAVVGAVKLRRDVLGKPHKARQRGAWVTFTRTGTTTREATREEEARLYEAAQFSRYELKAVQGIGMSGLDQQRVRNYYRDVIKRSVPARKDAEGWRMLLLNSDLLVEEYGELAASVAGVLLFGEDPNRRLPQAGVTAVAFPGPEKDYNTVDEEIIRGPLTPLISKRGEVLAKGVIDRTVEFAARNMGTIAWLEGGRRQRKKEYPIEAVREAIVNAVAHRDYAREGTDVEVSLYSDRLEVISPGRLPNGVTVAKMREGVVRAARNGLLKDILRDYGYIEHFGMGVRNRIIESMRRHNQTEPDLIEQDDRFTVRLWKSRSKS